MEEFLKPIAEQIVAQIDAVSEGAEFPSRRLGPSKLGHVCTAYPWHLYRWSAKVTKKGKHQRTAASGKDDERRVLAAMKAAGWQIRDIGPDGEQITVRSHNGHVVSKVEGVGTHADWFHAQPVLIEVKGMNKRRFNGVRSGKPLREVEPQYYAQIIVYMQKLNLAYCVFVAYCRDDGELFVVTVAADPVEAERLDDLAWSILRSKLPLAKVSNNATNHICKQCDMIEPCQFRAAPPRTCRSCLHCTASETDFGMMHCERWGNSIPDDFIETTCDQYTRLI